MRKIRKGVFIVLEGIDGCGKSTQLDLLTKHLDELGERYHVVHYPNYDGPTGSIIGHMLKGDVWLAANSGYPSLKEDSARVLQAMFAVDRYETSDQIEGLLEQGINVICDRYFYSSMAYGEAQDLSINWVLEINRRQTLPDIAVLVDVPVEASLERRPVREDSFESNLDLLKGAREAYRNVWKTWSSVSYQVVDGCQDIQRVSEEICDFFDWHLEDKRRIQGLPKRWPDRKYLLDCRIMEAVERETQAWKERDNAR